VAKQKKSADKIPPARLVPRKPTELLGEKSLPAWARIVIAILVIYFMILLIFPQNVFSNYDFKFGGDNLSAAPVAQMGQEFAKSGKVPNWCPYIMGGMPTVGSLLYANDYYPGFAIGRWLAFVFFGSKHAWLFLHFLLAGFGVFLVLRELGVHWTFAALCGLFFAFNPQMVVFADVGHGSKLMTIAYLPWILLFTKRLFDRPVPGRAAALALTFGLALLALHVQIAYYGAMMMGLYAVYAFIAGGKAELSQNIRATVMMAAAGVLAFGISAPLYLQVQEYSHYSIRGGGATGGASWDYATAWSFSPMESLTYIFPSFFGFGGQTYWGSMPFTDMPLYWGGAILLFAPWALVLKRDRLTWFLVILAGLAWVVSFGKFLPLLYSPLFHLLPYFNKFRVPSLIQVLVLLPVVVLAGRALQALWEKIREGGQPAADLARKFALAGGIIAGFCLLLLILQVAVKPMYMGWVAAARPQMAGAGAEQAFGLFTGDLLRLLALTVGLYGAALLALKRSLPGWALVVAVALAAALELNFFDKSLTTSTPPQQMESYLAADDVVQFLQSQPRPFRVFPLSQNRSPDWYMPHRLESIMGYTGAKPRLYQEAVDKLTYNNPNFLRMMNVVYFISEQPIQHDEFEEVFAGKQEHVYRFKHALPRAFLANQILPSTSSQALEYYNAMNFDFTRTAAVESPPAGTLDATATGQVSWVKHDPDYLELNVETTGPMLLVITDNYYPSGWKATVDGQPATISKTDFMFRGVMVPAGKSRVEMTFAPKSAGKGNILKWISLVLIVAGLASLLIKKPGSSSKPAHTS
jgi:hypothetical protein